MHGIHCKTVESTVCTLHTSIKDQQMGMFIKWNEINKVMQLDELALYHLSVNFVGIVLMTVCVCVYLPSVVANPVYFVPTYIYYLFIIFSICRYEHIGSLQIPSRWNDIDIDQTNKYHTEHTLRKISFKSLPNGRSVYWRFCIHIYRFESKWA